ACDSCVPRRLDIFAVGLKISGYVVVRIQAKRRLEDRLMGILRRRLLRPAALSSSALTSRSGGRWLGKARISKAVDQPRVNNQSLTIDDGRFRRCLDVGANSFNQPVANDNGAASDHRSGNRKYSGIFDRVDGSHALRLIRSTRN